jgi:hypothetical protein
MPLLGVLLTNVDQSVDRRPLFVVNSIFTFSIPVEIHLIFTGEPAVYTSPALGDVIEIVPGTLLLIRVLFNVASEPSLTSTATESLK